jgi:hypothetical protein
VKANYRRLVTFLLVLVVVLLAAAFLRNRAVQIEKTPGASVVDRVKAIRSTKFALPQSNTLQPGTDDATPPSLRAEPEAARGAGYIWGTALKNVYASASLSPDGTTRLDVSDMVKSFKGYVAPVDLANASASSNLRAEYLSATITAALDLDVSNQPNFVAILQSYYASDARAQDRDETARENRRSELSNDARRRIVPALPQEALDQFRDIFRSPTFLFQTMSVAAENIEYGFDGSRISAKGSAVFAIKSDGSRSITAESTSATSIRLKESH